MMPALISLMPICFDPRPREGGDVARGARRRNRDRVSIHAPAKGATRGGFHARPRRGFRSTPPRRGRLIMLGSTSVSMPFRSTPPRRGRPGPVRPPARLACFDPRPREGGDSLSRLRDAQVTGFDPRPREGGDIQRAFSIVREGVSIHAPAKGATSTALYWGCMVLFRSTPPRRGRHPRFLSQLNRACFDPRPREGGDPPPAAGGLVDIVSIHAPAKGATSGCRPPH